MDFLSDHGGLFGFLGFVIAGLIGLYTVYRYALADRREQLDDCAERDALLAHRADGPGQIYRGALLGVTQWADRFYGTKKLGWRAFERCLTLAFVYPVVAALLA